MIGMFVGCENIPDISNWDTSKDIIYNSSSPINIMFTLSNGKKINIIGNEFMTFSNLIKSFYIKAKGNKYLIEYNYEKMQS